MTENSNEKNPFLEDDEKGKEGNDENPFITGEDPPESEGIETIQKNIIAELEKKDITELQIDENLRVEKVRGDYIIFVSLDEIHNASIDVQSACKEHLKKIKDVLEKN